MKRRTLTILFADLQGYFPRIDHQSNPDTVKLANELKSIVDVNSEKHNGTFLKTMNNGILLAFESPTDGVRCARDMSNQIDKRNNHLRKQKDFTRFRIGISTGEIHVDIDGSVQGEALNAALRLQKFSEANNVYLAESTYLATDKTGILMENIGQDINQTQVYKILKISPAGLHPFQKSKLLPMLFVFIALANVFFLIVAFFILSRQKPDIDEMMAKEDYPGVAALATDLISQDPSNLHVHELALYSLIKLKKYTEAQNHFKDILGIHPEGKAYCNVTADYLVAEGKYQLASEWLQKYCEGEQEDTVQNGEPASQSSADVSQ